MYSVTDLPGEQRLCLTATLLDWRQHSNQDCLTMQLTELAPPNLDCPQDASASADGQTLKGLSLPEPAIRERYSVTASLGGPQQALT